MDITLKKWDVGLKETLSDICGKIDRAYLSDRLPDPYTEDDAAWFINMVSEHDGKDGVFRAVCADGRIIGNISVEQKSDVYRKDGEIGYYLLPSFSSKGIMTEAVGRICEIAFSELDIVRITGHVFAPNKASARVLLKNGFLLEGTLKNAVFKNDKLYDLLIYGKVK
ncbi:MAG: GNAT family N-acetyltransferase [Clostridiales bacterium]|nr:GNAT family N-acetyltransferase [Clostridiales bacterium]